MVTMESRPSGGAMEPSNGNSEDNTGSEVSFDITVVNENDIDHMHKKNAYIKELTDGCYLSLLQEAKTKNAYKNNKEKGLFHLMFTTAFFDTCLKWMNDELLRKGKPKVSKEKFMVYVGLEIAMSLVPLNAINQYWETKKFSGHQDFKDVMSRNDFPPSFILRSTTMS